VVVGCRAPERAEPPWQALDGLEGEFEYSMVGHSGSGPEAEQLIRWGEPPQGAKARLALLQCIAPYTQFCHPGHHTFEASDLAIKEVRRGPGHCPRPASAAALLDAGAQVAERAADERFVFVISDADLARYNKQPQEWSRILTSQPAVGAFAILIASNESEADRIHAALAPGRGHVCTDTAQRKAAGIEPAPGS